MYAGVATASPTVLIIIPIVAALTAAVFVNPCLSQDAAAPVRARIPGREPDRSDRSDRSDRTCREKIDKAGSVTPRVAGRLRHIGVGRSYARTDGILLVQNLHVAVVNAATGENLRDLGMDPRRQYQAIGRPPGPTKN